MPLKRITLRFASKCRKCGKSLPEGALAYWQGAGRGVICYPSCQSETQTATASTFKLVEGKAVATIDFPELKAAYLGMAENSYAPYFKEEGNRRFVRAHRSEWMADSSWFGCSGEQMVSWLRDGFKVDILKEIDPDLMPHRPRRKLRFADEGELQLDMMFSGEDYPFLEWERRRSKPGMRVSIDLDANGGVPAQVIADYERWIARALYTLENLGFDVQVDIRILSNGLTHTLPNPVETRIRVKRENEIADFASWSAMFSPGGFRHLCFLSFAMTCDRLGTSIYNFGGDATSTAWGVRFDKETRTLAFTISRSSYSGFPEGKMTEQLLNVLRSDYQGN